MKVNDAIQKLNHMDERLHALNHAMGMISLDAALGAPKNSVNGRAKTLSILSREYYNILINEDTKEVLSHIINNNDSIKNINYKKAMEFQNIYDKIAKIPADEFAKYTALISKSNSAWEEAKINNDFKLFAPYLKEVIEFIKRFIDYRGYEKHPYNTLLGDYEKGLTTDDLDDFFSELKSTIVPLVASIKNSSVDIKSSFLYEEYDVKKQEEFSRWLLKVIGFNMDSGQLAVSEHPFTSHFNCNDVRITTHFYKKNLLSAIYSTIHEAGHAIYEQNIDESLDFTVLSSGTSMGIHESQSRFYENIIGRSYEFIEYIYPRLQKTFPKQLRNTTVMDMFLAANKAEPSLIRVDADELTYSLHIMIRYEIEKLLFDNTINFEELPEIWNEKYQEYLAISPKNYSEGILQDVHWSEGYFGYFPSYALGNAYASQFAHYMRKSANLKVNLKNGNINNINTWLKDNIHKHGKLLNPNEIIKKVTGESLNAKYYTDYLKDKYKKIYRL